MSDFSPTPREVAQERTKTASNHRPVFMSRTSDVFGSHIKTDMDSYLSLIRRKIQEKCATTMELITSIRRNKISDSGHVTPNEFRFTLIKFGIILPQPLVDQIFNVFDSDRSGTMDFDEFAMWIMNSEFRPDLSKNKQEESPLTALRKKFYGCVKKYDKLFDNLPVQLSFLAFVSHVNRVQMPITDREARTIFQLLDPKDTGFVESAHLVTWAKTGKTNLPPSTKVAPKPIEAKNVNDLVRKVLGRSTRQLEASFSHIKRGEGIRLPFEEFRRCLLNAGTGKSIHDVKQLWGALGGKDVGTASIDLMFDNLDPVLVDPVTDVSLKPQIPATVSTTRADRRLREALRKCFQQVKHDLERHDPQSTGYVEAEFLYKLLIKRCTPMTFQDFRFIVQQVKKEPGTTRIDYNHFLHGYNPIIPPHELQGIRTLKKYDEFLKEEADQRAEKEAEALHNPWSSTSRAILKTNTHKSTLDSANPSLTMDGVQSSMARASLSKSSAATPPSSALSNRGAKDDMFLKTTASSLAAGGSAGNDQLRKIWQNVLRECHRNDPDRSGQVSRTAFIGALEKANFGKTMTPATMNQLADSYTLSSGLINYLACFRTFLNDLAGTANPLSKSASSINLGNSNNNNNNNAMENSGGSGSQLLLRPIHPWDFDYKRERHAVPYWKTAVAMPKDLEAMHTASLGTTVIPAPGEKMVDKLTGAERQAVLNQYSPQIQQVCAKAYKLFEPIWRDLRNQFKKAQIVSQRGSIQVSHFLTIMENNGVMLSKTELGSIVRAFRGLGMQEVVKFDEFFRVCMLMKDA